MRQKNRVPLIDPLSLDRGSVITKYQAVGLIADEVRKNDESIRQARDRVRKRIDYAVKKGKLKQDHHHQIGFGELAAWAQTNWRGNFTDWPATQTGEIEFTLQGITGDIKGALPESLEVCHARIKELTSEVQALRREVGALRPVKVREDEKRRKNRESARRPRGGRVK